MRTDKEKGEAIPESFSRSLLHKSATVDEDGALNSFTSLRVHGIDRKGRSFLPGTGEQVVHDCSGREREREGASKVFAVWERNRVAQIHSTDAANRTPGRIGSGPRQCRPQRWPHQQYYGITWTVEGL